MSRHRHRRRRRRHRRRLRRRRHSRRRRHRRRHCRRYRRHAVVVIVRCEGLVQENFGHGCIEPSFENMDLGLKLWLVLDEDLI